MPRKKKNNLDGAGNGGGKYIDLHDAPASQSAKMSLLYIIAGMFAIVLAFVWLNSIKVSLADQSDVLGLSRLSSDIQNGISRYGQDPAAAAQNQSSASPVINLSAISASVESDISSQTSTDGWLSKKFPGIGIDMKFPGQWQAISSGSKLTLTSSTTKATSTQMRIETLANPQKIALAAWLKTRPEELEGLNADTAAPISSVSTTIFKYVSASSSDSKIYYLSSESSRQILRISTSAKGEDQKLNAIFERIITNINLMK